MAAIEFQDEITARIPFFADVTAMSARDAKPANDSTVAYLHAFDVYALHQEQRRAMQTRGMMLRALLLSIPEAEWPSRGGRHV